MEGLKAKSGYTDLEVLLIRLKRRVPADGLILQATICGERITYEASHQMFGKIVGETPEEVTRQVDIEMLVRETQPSLGL